MIALPLLGCGKVFGLTEVPLPEPYAVNGAIGHDVVDLANLSHRTEILHPPFALGEVTLAASYAQMLEEPVDLTGTNTFAFEPIGPYALAIRRAGMAPIQLDGDETTATVAFDLLDLGRVDAAPVPTPSPTISFAGVTGFTAMDVPVIETQGIYTESVLPAIDTLPSASPLTWSAAGKLGTTFGMLEISHEQVYVTAHATDATTNVATIRAYLPTNLTLAPGDNPVTGTLGVNNAPKRCVHLVAHRGDELDHVRNSLEVPPFSTKVRWSLLAVPAPDLTPAGGALVAYEAETLPELTAVHDVPLLAFGNPYDQMALVASFGARTTYRFTAPGATAASLQAGTVAFTSPIATGDCAPPVPLVELGVVVAIPGVPSLGQTRLTQAQTIAVTGDFVELTWNEVASGVVPTDAFHLVIYDIVNDAGATRLDVVRRVFTRAPRTRLPAAIFVPGHTYAVRVESRIGYPGAATGDYARIAYPFGAGAVLSAPFTIAAR